MSEATLLESRLSKVERDNRRLKLTVGALLLVLAAVPLIGALMFQEIPGMALGSFLLLLAAVPLIGAVMPEQIPDVIDARMFRVIDQNGRCRHLMNHQGYAYWDENETIRVGINGTCIFYRGENGTCRVEMDTNGLTHYTKDGNVVWSTPER
jgi:hypothetical protein